MRLVLMWDETSFIKRLLHFNKHVFAFIKINWEIKTSWCIFLRSSFSDLLTTKCSNMHTKFYHLVIARATWRHTYYRRWSISPRLLYLINTLMGGFKLTIRVVRAGIREPLFAFVFSSQIMTSYHTAIHHASYMVWSLIREH